MAAYHKKPQIKIYQGYAWYKMDGHPRSNNGYLKRSVLILEEKLGRSLLPGEMVHHIDGDRLNDDPDNLEITTRSKHMSDHRPIDARWGKLKERISNLKAQGWNSRKIAKWLDVTLEIVERRL